MLKFFTYLLVCLPLFLQADDWYYGTALDGKAKEFHGSRDMHKKFILAPPRPESYWLRQLSKYDGQANDVAERFKAETDKRKRVILADDLQRLRNNRARCLMLVGKVDKALVSLLDIESKFPGESTVAENIANCYELKKDYEKALVWIEKAADRNSMSIYSNLWVYRKIIGTRSRLSKNSDYLKTNAVSGQELDKKSLELPFEELRTMEHWHKRYKLGSAAKHIREQLQLRLQIGKSSNDVVLASLMEELATIYAVAEVCEIAVPVYELALQYGHPNPELINSRIAQLNKLIESNDKSMSYSRSLSEKLSRSTKLIGVAVISLILLILLAWWNSAKKEKA
ncbi:MAG: hypothetical protein NE334_10265 [Lentisphaeraceae bacterium]|nr:hypothetical protein [Lentisphaeraceae bacterium]